ncbi:MAG: GNAT family N-acetyltransferase [Phaeodactylibacter sp.]|uniref:GNAT family N-acetyltransferase n=1 Tax=Phaeodactylibacter sp. TaxID=1940289 RepID=UPI0032ED5397
MSFRACCGSPLPAAEIKNIALQADLQGRELGRQLLHFLIAEARRQGFRRLQVATGNSSISQLAFYQKAGFEMLRIDRHYFTRNYPEPIIENGIPCRHRVWLELELS